MANYYFDPTSWNDTTWNGSILSPYKTANKCSSVASGSGNIAYMLGGPHLLTANVTDQVDPGKISDIVGYDLDGRTNCFDGDSHTYNYTFELTTSNPITITSIGWKHTRAYPRVISYQWQPTLTLINVFFQNNKDVGNAWGSIWFQNITSIGRVTMRGGTIWDFDDSNYSSFIFLSGWSQTEVDVYNNTFYFENGSPGLGIVSNYLVTGSNHNWRLRNNIVVNKEVSDTFYLVAPQTAWSVNLTLDKNNLWEDWGNISLYTGTLASFSEGTNYDYDPVFNDEVNGDFNPVSWSPEVIKTWGYKY